MLMEPDQAQRRGSDWTFIESFRNGLNRFEKSMGYGQDPVSADLLGSDRVAPQADNISRLTNLSPPLRARPRPRHPGAREKVEATIHALAIKGPSGKWKVESHLVLEKHGDIMHPSAIYRIIKVVLCQLSEGTPIQPPRPKVAVPVPTDMSQRFEIRLAGAWLSVPPEADVVRLAEVLRAIRASAVP